MRVGQRIEQTRQRRELSFREAGEELGVDGSAVLRWTAGVTLPTLSRLPRIAEWCDVDYDVLRLEWRTDTADKRQGISLAVEQPVDLGSALRQVHELRDALEAALVEIRHR